MKNIFIAIGGIAFILFSVYGCTKKVNGDGDIVTQERNLSSFNAIDVSGNIEVIYTQSNEQTVSVKTDENLQSYIETELKNNTLEIYQKSRTNIKPTDGIVVTISAPTLKSVKLSGNCEFKTGNKILEIDEFLCDFSGATKCSVSIIAKKLIVALSGAAKGNFTGSSNNFNIDVSGASKIEAYELKAEGVNADASGSAVIEVFSNGYITFNASGASTLYYKGDASIEKNVSGSAHVIKK